MGGVRKSPKMQDLVISGTRNIALVTVTNHTNLKRPLWLDEPSFGHMRLFDGESDSRIVT